MLHHLQCLNLRDMEPNKNNPDNIYLKIHINILKQIFTLCSLNAIINKIRKDSLSI